MLKLICYFIILICYQVEGSRANVVNCKENQFRCKDGKCIDKIRLCDGTIDCIQGSDEHDCIKDNSIESGNVDESLQHNRRQPSEARREDSQLFYYEEETILGDEPKRFQVIEIGDPNYFNLHTYEYEDVKKRSLDWLIAQRNQDFGWGQETPRAIMALYLSKYQDSEIENELMSKQLHLQLSLAIARNYSKEIPLAELAMYINALQVSCSNAKNFYGFDLVNILRQRVNTAHNSGQVVVPLVYLTLCLNDAITYNDSKKLNEMSQAKYSIGAVVNRIDFQAIALMASVCMVKLPGNSNGLHTFNSFKNKIAYDVHNDGIPKNVYESALIVQALNEARIDPVAWNRTTVMDFILKQQKENGSFGDILATYYVLPIFSGKSLLSINENCRQYNFGDLKPLEVLKNKHKSLSINYGLWYGSPVEYKQVVNLQVAEGTTFYDVMRLAEESNPVFRFRLDNSSLSEVYSIGGIPNDAERGLFWELFLEKEQRSATGASLWEPVPHTKSIKKIMPRHGENIFFWYKPLGNWGTRWNIPYRT